LGDLDDLAPIFASEEVNRFLYFEPRDREETLATLKRREERPEDAEVENLLNVAVVLKETSRVIGDFILRWSENEHHQGEIGGSLHPDFHGQGFAPEVYEELLTIGFTDYGLHRIVGRCDGRNVASIRALEKVGLHQEAHLIENEFIKGEWTDEIVMAIRKSEWTSRNL
jgi:RimJ/RimL family protein N-acetyltransferase